ncbi:Uncharacterised protein [Mycobacteroides abscessus subsp. abscessus]|nr:Uncharacterised protein [Mycobacteroides abscessus subsp. abscessus]
MHPGHHRAEIDVEFTMQGAQILVCEAAQPHHARVVHQHVDRGVRPGGGQKGPKARLLGDVEGVGVRADRGRCPGRLAVVPVSDPHPCAARDQCLGGGPADSARASGHTDRGAAYLDHSGLPIGSRRAK